jgi:hypothetical protein
MRLKKYITEIFKKNIQVKTTYSSETEYEVRFKAAGEEWIFTAKNIYQDDWEILFNNINTDPKNPWSITGNIGEKAFEVFTGVGNSLVKFIKDKKPNEFHFSATEPSRIKLYKKISKLIERKTGYEHIVTKEGGKTIFWFSK